MKDPWTEECPTEPGWYWWKNGYKECIVCVAEGPWPGLALLDPMDSRSLTTPEGAGGQWCLTPIRTPEQMMRDRQKSRRAIYSRAPVKLSPVEAENLLRLRETWAKE